MDFLTTIMRVTIIGSFVLAGFLAASGNAYAQSPERLLGDLMERDLDIWNAMIDLMNNAPLETSTERRSLSGNLNDYAGRFESSAAEYKALSNNINPNLAQSSRTAAQAASTVAEGARMASRGLLSRSNARFSSGIDRMNAGSDSYDSAFQQFDSSSGDLRSYPGANFAMDNQHSILVGFGIAVAGVVFVSVYLAASGSVINSRFTNNIAAAIRGDNGSVSINRVSTLYGVNLILLVILGYVSIVLAVISVIAFAGGGAFILFQLPRIPLILPLALLIVLATSLWGVAKAIFSPIRTGGFGILINKTDEQVMWEFSVQVALEMQTEPADSILISPLSGVSVHEEGGMFHLLLGRTRRVLTIGLPSVAGLTQAEFHAILAHEYGHFSNRDTAWSVLTSRAGSAVSQTLEVMNSSQSTGSFIINVVALLNPALWVLTAYWWLFSYMTMSYSRVRELLADQAAISLAGSLNFRNGLEKVVINDTIYNSQTLPSLRELLAKGQMFTNIFEQQITAIASITPEQRDSIINSMESQISSSFDSHPPVNVRLQLADRARKLGSQREILAVELLFSNWKEISGELSDAFSNYYSSYIGYGTA